MKRKSKTKVKKARAWGWEFPKGELCYWAAPTREMLLSGRKPSPEAKAVPVYIIIRRGAP